MKKKTWLSIFLVLLGCFSLSAHAKKTKFCIINRNFLPSSISRVQTWYNSEEAARENIPNPWDNEYLEVVSKNELQKRIQQEKERDRRSNSPLLSYEFQEKKTQKAFKKQVRKEKKRRLKKHKKKKHKKKSKKRRTKSF